MRQCLNFRRFSFVLMSASLAAGLIWSFLVPSTSAETNATSVSADTLVSTAAYANGFGYEVEFEINETASADDDYLTWAPTFCRARVSHRVTNDLKVVLSNDGTISIPDGGDVCFAPYQHPWPPHTTATQSTLELTLPCDCSWVSFVIAGKFGKPSVRDKDAVIEARFCKASGPLINTHPVMVRVRKDAATMTDEERDLFLESVAALNATPVGSLYREINEIHGRAALDNDEGHRQAAFLPWHRALTLQFERSLQNQPSVPAGKYRAVTVPYHNWDAAAANVFHRDFMGRRSGSFGLPDFAPVTNPMDGFVIGEVGHVMLPDSSVPLPDGSQLSDTPLPADLVFVRRSGEDETLRPWSGFGPYFVPLSADPYSTADPLLENKNYKEFREQQEGSAHNPGHYWNCGDGHLISGQNTARDPMFFFLHCQCDRQWAAWQNYRNAFGENPSVDYITPDNLLAFDHTKTSPAGFDNLQLGTYFNDAMWPWDGKAGTGEHGDARELRPTHAPGDPFRQAPANNLWPPTATAIVRPSDVIDYEGRVNPRGSASPRLGLGYCYDDIPFQTGPTGVLHHFTILVGDLLSPYDQHDTGVPFNVTVTGVDVFGNVIPSYDGLVTLDHSGTPGSTGPDSGVHIGDITVPGHDQHQFVASDNGVHAFTVTAHSVEEVRFNVTAAVGGHVGNSYPVEIVSP